MLRVKVDVLNVESKKYCYMGRIFDGLAYTSPDSTCNAIRIINGEPMGAYASPYFCEDQPSHSIDITGFTEEDVEDIEGVICNDSGLSFRRTVGGLTLFRNEEPFTGLAFKFFGPFCTREYGYKDGIVVSDARWNVDGQLLELSFENEIDECYSWYPNGEREVAWISLVKTHPVRGAERILRLSLRFSIDGKLNSIAATGTRDELGQLIDSHSYFPVRKLMELGNYVAAERCVFFEGDVTFQLFMELAGNNGFCTTVEISLPAKFLMHDAGIAALGDMRALRKVSFSSSDGTELEAARKLKNRRPDLEIECDVTN